MSDDDRARRADSRKVRREALKIATQLVRVLPTTDDAFRDAMKLRDLLRMPSMASILKRVPGKTTTERCRTLGIGRQSYYDWSKGASRPNSELAERLARAARVPIEFVRGRGRSRPSRPIQPIQPDLPLEEPPPP